MVSVTTKKPAAAPTGEIAAFAKKSQQFKLEGDVLFAKQEIGQALDKYTKAQQLALSGTPEFAAILANKAACWLKARRFEEALADCNLALEGQPNFKAGLLRRATVYEACGVFAHAINDLEQILQQDPRDESIKARLTKVKKALAIQEKQKRAAGPAGLGGASVSRNAAQAKQQQLQAQRARQQSQQTLFTFSTTWKGETKEIQLPVTLTYADLRVAIKKEYGIENHIIVKYKDFDGDFVTISSRMDLRAALTNFAAVAEREAKETGERPGSPIPVIRVEAFPSTVEVVETPDLVQPDVLGENEEQGDDVIEIDEWLLSFATLFRKALGDAAPKEGSLELRTVGLEKCCETLEATVGSPEARALLKAASDKFQEAAAAAIFNWGNVFACNTRRVIDACEPQREDGAGSTDEALAVAAKTQMAALDADYERCIERFQEALKIKSDFFEAPITWGQQAFERAKLYHHLAKDSTGGAKSEAEKTADEMFALAITKYQEAMQMLSPAERDVVLTENSPEAGGVKAQILILWGNVLYEQSQVKQSRGDKKWKADTEAAVAKFNEAGCSKDDIKRALMNHASEEWKNEEDAAKAAGAK